MEIENLVEMTAICIDGGGQALRPPFLNLVMDGNPLLIHMYKQFVRDAHCVVLWDNGSDEEVLVGTMNREPTKHEMDRLNKMGFWVYYRYE